PLRNPERLFGKPRLKRLHLPLAPGDLPLTLNQAALTCRACLRLLRDVLLLLAQTKLGAGVLLLCLCRAALALADPLVLLSHHVLALGELLFGPLTRRAGLIELSHLVRELARPLGK